jgi:hypothetical protein
VEEREIHEFFFSAAEVDACDVSYPSHCPQNCSCYNHIVRCSHAQLTHIPYEQMPIDTEELYLDANEIEEIPVELTKRLVYLVRIDLSYNKLRAIAANLFSNLTRLETLILSYNKIRCLESSSFKGLKNLRILYVTLTLISFVRSAYLSVRLVDRCMEMRFPPSRKVPSTISRLSRMCK